MGKVVGFSLPRCWPFLWSVKPNTVGYSPKHAFSSCYRKSIEKISILFPKWAAKSESINPLLASRDSHFSLWCALQHIDLVTIKVIKSINTQERPGPPANLFLDIGKITCSLLLHLFRLLCLACWGGCNPVCPKRGCSELRERSIKSEWNLGQPFCKSLSASLKCWLSVLSFLPKKPPKLLIFSARRYQCNDCSH